MWTVTGGERCDETASWGSWGCDKERRQSTRAGGARRAKYVFRGRPDVNIDVDSRDSGGGDNGEVQVHSWKVGHLALPSLEMTESACTWRSSFAPHGQAHILNQPTMIRLPLICLPNTSALCNTLHLTSHHILPTATGFALGLVLYTYRRPKGKRECWPIHSRM